MVLRAMATQYMPPSGSAATLLHTISITARIEAAQADPQKARSLKLALGEIRRFEIKIDASGMVDPLEVSKQMKAAGVAPETIIQMKANLHAAGFLD